MGYLKVVRSPAKVTWHLQCNGITIHCGDKHECNELKRKFEREFGV